MAVNKIITFYLSIFSFAALISIGLTFVALNFMSYAYELPVPAGSLGLLMLTMNPPMKAMRFMLENDLLRQILTIAMVWAAHIVPYSFLLIRIRAGVTRWKLILSGAMLALMIFTSALYNYQGIPLALKFHNRFYLTNGLTYPILAYIFCIYLHMRQKTRQSLEQLIIVNAIISCCFWVFMFPWLGEWI